MDAVTIGMAARDINAFYPARAAKIVMRASTIELIVGDRIQ